MAMLDIEAVLRRELWLHHGCSIDALYGDDGEMQCSQGLPYHRPIDFKREPIEQIYEKVASARLIRAGEATSGLVFCLGHEHWIPEGQKGCPAGWMEEEFRKRSED